MAADLDKIIARLTDEKTPFTKISRQGLVGAVEAGNLSFEQANQLIDDAQAQAAGTAEPQEAPDITVESLSRSERGRGLNAAEKAADEISPEDSLNDAITQFRESQSTNPDRQTSAQFELSDGRTGTISGTQDEIRAAISTMEDRITDDKITTAQEGEDEPAAQAAKELASSIKEESGAIDNTFLDDVASNLVAEGDIAMVMLSGAIAEPISGIAGILGLGMSGGDPDVAANWVENVSEWMTIAPQSDKGKKALGFVGEKMMVVEEAIDDTAVKISRGNPLAATAFKTAVLGSFDLFALGKGVRAARKLDRGLANVQKMADDLGINTEPTAFKTSFVEKVKEMTPDEFASNQTVLKKELMDAERAQKTAVTKKFDEAKDIDAYVKADSIEEFGAGLREHLIDEGFDLDDLKKVNDSLDDLTNIRTKKPGRGARDNVGEFGSGAAPKQLIAGKVIDVQLNDLQLIRKRINRRHSNAQGAGESNAALSLVKDKLDDFLDTQFNKDAIRGDKAGVTRWREANSAFADYKKNFSSDKFIRKMIEEEATPEQYRRWFLGASAMGANPQVGATIRNLKKILGDDSPQLDAIRTDLLHDVARPIFEGKGGRPDFEGFVRNYDRMIGKNPSLVKELGLNVDDLSNMRKLAAAAKFVEGRRFMNLDLSTGVARFVFGHKIARAAMRVTMARGAIDMIFQTGKTGRRSLLAHTLGDPDILKKPLIPRQGLAAATVIVNEANQRQRKESKHD